MLSSLGIQTGFLGLWGEKVDAIDHYIAEIEKLNDQVSVTIFSYIQRFLLEITENVFFLISFVDNGGKEEGKER